MAAKYFSMPQPIFEDRHDAGQRLATELSEYGGRSAVVFAIPNSGVPVALEVASAIKAELDLVICRKVLLQLNPEGSLGAAADDGAVVLNDEAVKRAGLTRQQLEHDISQVRADIRQRRLLYKRDLPIARVGGRTVIIVDDGLASGYTMMAAVESVRRRQPKEIVVAVPVASAVAFERLEKMADRVIACAIGHMSKFYLSDFYRYLYDLSDNDVVRYLRQWRAQKFRAITEPKQ